MPTRSRFLEDRGFVTRPAAKFERWLTSQGYVSCNKHYPAAVQATGFVDEYLRDYPEREDHREQVEQHADEIGWISDFEIDREELDGQDD